MGKKEKASYGWHGVGYSFVYEFPSGVMGYRVLGSIKCCVCLCIYMLLSMQEWHYNVKYLFGYDFLVNLWANDSSGIMSFSFSF